MRPLTSRTAADLEDSAEGTGDNNLGRHSGGSGALGAEGYLIGTGVASLMRMAVVVALMAVPFMGVVVVTLVAVTLV